MSSKFCGFSVMLFLPLTLFEERTIGVSEAHHHDQAANRDHCVDEHGRNTQNSSGLTDLGHES